MEGSYSNENILLRKNIELLEQGITLQQFLQKEKNLEINESTELYNYFGIFVIYDKTEKFYNILGGIRHEMGTCCDLESVGDFIHKIIEEKYMEDMYQCFLKDVIFLKYYRLNRKKYPSVEEYNARKYNEYRYEEYENDFNVLYDEIDRYYWAEINKGNWIKRKIVIVANSLLRLQRKSTILYELLNAVVDVIVKPLPVFIWLLVENKSNIFVGENIIQKLLYGMFGITGYFLSSIAIYLMLLVAFALVKLIIFREKPEVGLRIFDLIISMSDNRKKYVKRVGGKA